MRSTSVLLWAALTLSGCSDESDVAAMPMVDGSTDDGATQADGGGPDGEADADLPDGGGPDADTDCADAPTGAPEPRGEMNGILDPARRRILTYGGNTAAPVMCIPMYDLVAELWSFDLNCKAWTKLGDNEGPAVRARHSTALDASGDRMLLFGGRERRGFGEYENFNDLWALDLASHTWSQIVTTGEGPSPRSSSSLVVDETNNRLLVFGGNTSTSGLSLTGSADLFALDLNDNSWSEISAPGTPGPRLYHSAVVVGDEMVIFGGTPNFNGPFWNDAYAFDMTTDTWRPLTDDVRLAPARRFGAELVADPERDRVLMVAGHDDTSFGNRNDVWALDLDGGGWSRVRPGDTQTNEPNGQCDFPADFAEPEPNSPERRYSFLRGQDGTDAYIFGGKTDCGNVNDVWHLDVATGEWTLLRASNGGEACLRSERTSCSSLCN